MSVENWPEGAILVELTGQAPRHEELQQAIDTVQAAGDCHVVVDFSNADVVGSPTLSRLLELRRVLRESGHKLILCHVSPATKGVFTATQIDRLFDFVEDRSAALASL